MYRGPLFLVQEGCEQPQGLEPLGHSEMLSAIAEEMWRTGAFSLDAEELKIAAEIGLAESSIPPSILPQVLDRLPTHAACQT